MKIRTVTIDFWGTLLWDLPVSDERYKRVRLDGFQNALAAAGLTVARPALERAYEASRGFLARVWATQRDVSAEEHVRAILTAADPALPQRLPAATLAALLDAFARPALLVPPTVDPGALGALPALRARGLTLAVVSNTMRTPGAILRRLLAHYGLLEHFSHTTFSDEVGVRKPAPEIFWLTLKAVGGEAESAVHVGDDPVLDVQGARVAGMRVVQVSRGGRRAAGLEADAVIEGLAALPDVIDELAAR
ncbi:MAG TPA: HAD family hydrolase [Methylomirabilota bacterium]|nr:HAD family hydrolase [Methylomirabilota bacterium]